MRRSRILRMVVPLLVLFPLTVEQGSAAGAKQVNAPVRATRMRPPPVPNGAALRVRYHGQTLTFLGDNAIGNSHTRDLALAAEFTRDTGIKVKVAPHPVSSNDSYNQLVNAFRAHSAAYDVVMIDVIYPGAFAPNLVDLTKYFSRAEINRQSATVIANDTINGRLVAMPWFGDFGILYYRTDLLKKYGFHHPPRTWTELGHMAQIIERGEQKSNKNFYGYVYQGAAYEGLTCNALEWLASVGGGRFIDNGKVTIDNSAARSMLNLMAGWVGTIAPRTVTSFQEEDARLTFDNGNAAFMRNWPSAYAASLSTSVAGKFDVAALPHATGHSSMGAVGGWQLGVPRYSRHIGAAAELVRYLTSPAVQRYDAIVNSNVPTIPSVANDPLVRKTNPYLKPSINDTIRVVRPGKYLKDRYVAGSRIIYDGINQILSGQRADRVLPQLQRQLQRLVMP
ncbi:MAG TPA: ABC transporter substrate-binding protein [Chloroflexota bacterium]|nr:ABC transporter substrate-binding protein [Chloroflexota bacterium]